MSFPVNLSQTSCYAVIFTSVRRNTDGYEPMAARMDELATNQPGYLGVESIANNDASITISYWKTEDDIKQWKQNLDHSQAQKYGREKWYEEYRVRVCKVERSYGFSAKI